MGPPPHRICIQCMAVKSSVVYLVELAVELVADDTKAKDVLYFNHRYWNLKRAQL